MKLFSAFVAIYLCVSRIAALTVRSETQAVYHRPDTELVENEYLVFLRANYTLEAHFDRIGKNLSQSAPLFYNLRSLGCYRAQLDHFTLHELVRYDPGVRYVEHSSVVHHVGSVGNGTTLPPAEHPYSSKKSIFARSSWVPRATVIQASKMWRYYFASLISAGGPVDLTKMCTGQFDTFEDAGKGVDIYILDSGIRTSHEYFRTLGMTKADNIQRATNFQGLATSPYITNGNDATMKDQTGHGTHTAGLAGGADYGPAHRANLINVKVLAGSKNAGTTAGIAHAINDVVEAHRSNLAALDAKDPKARKGWTGSVINMSFTLPRAASALEEALEAAYKSGIPMAAAAGNDGNYSTLFPCINPKVLCVAASNQYYRLSSLSNYGDVDYVLPGINMVSASIASDSAEETLSGTSAASPLLAGIMAVFVGSESLNRDVAAVYDRVAANALKNIVKIPHRGVKDMLAKQKKTPNLFATTGINLVTGSSAFPYALTAKTKRMIDGVETDDVGVDGMDATMTIPDILATDSMNWLSLAPGPTRHT